MSEKKSSVKFDVPPPVASLDDSWLSLPPPTAAASAASPQPSASFHSAQLGSNLMREQSKRDPLFYYEAISVLGTGSMGSVTKVRKRDNVIGGSARADLRTFFQQEKQLHACFELPLIGSICQRFLQRREDALRASVHASAHVSSTSVPSPSRRPEQLYAMKSIHLSRVQDETFVAELLNEIDILRQMDHPHIVRPLETYNFRNQVFIIMELCTGGDLYSRDPYTEEEAARITRQILSAISYMHDHGLLHRDLKYENTLFVNNEPRSEIKLIDFGLSKAFGGERLSEGVGTIYSMAPEVINGSYTKQADLWSVGCICYMLLSSQMPFYGRKRRDVIDQILEGHVEFRGRRWKKISPSAKEFVQSLLIVDEDERATAEEALRSPWLHRAYSATVRNPHSEEIDNALSSVSRFANYSRLKKVALMVIAHKSTSNEIGILRKIFEQYDTKKKGVLSYEDFKAAFDAAGYPEDDCRRIFEATDIDGSGKIRYTEFLAATIEAQGAIDEQRLMEAFDRLDCDDSGYISVQNLRDILGEDLPAPELEAIIKEVDLTNDNQISYTEFLALWQDKHECMRDDIMKDMAYIDGHATDTSTCSPVSPGEEEKNVQAKATFMEVKLSGRRRLKDSNRLPSELALDNVCASSRSVVSLMSGTSLDFNEPSKSADV